MDSLPTMSNDTPPFTLNFQQKLEYLERKNQDLKQLKQKLLDHIHKKEEEHQKELESYAQRLDENKSYIRKLEDENLALRFEISELKDKGAQLRNQLSEVKALLRKYYFKAKASDTHLKTQSSCDANASLHSENILSPGLLQVPRLTSEKRSVKKDSAQLRPVPECQDNSPTVSLRIPSAVNEPYLDISMENKLDHSHSFLGLRDRTGSREGEDMSPIKLNRSFNSNASSLYYKEREPSIDDRGREPKSSRNALRYSSPDEDSPVRRPAKRPSSLSNKRPRSVSLSWIEGREYLYRFNALSQNIVSLAVRPEIDFDKIGNIIAPKEESFKQKMQDLGKKPPVLRYVSKNSQEYLDLHFQQTPKNKSINGLEPQETKKVFEDFFVIGVEKEDLKAFSKQHPDKKHAKLKAKILFKHPTETSPDHEAAHNSIPDFAFPFGVQVHKLKSTPSFSSLNPIIYISSEGDQRAKCFMFPLLSGNMTDKAVKMGEVIEESNSNHLLYIVCIAFKDFITMSDDDKPKKSLKDIKYWEVNKIMCFMTYYPLIDFFFDYLSKLLVIFAKDILKVERMMQISQVNMQDPTRHEIVDAHFTSKYLDDIVKKNIDEILTARALSFSDKIDFKIKGNFMEVKTALEIPERQTAYTMESEWACLTVFEYITLKDLLWLFTALMLERKLVFLSNNLYLLTATLSVLRCLMKPFNYPFPLIYNLPEVLMVICDAPGAALIGINKGEDFLQTRKLLEEYPSCVFVCLDEEKIYLEKENQIEIPSLENFEKALLGYYYKLNPSLNRTITDPKKPTNRPIRTRGLKYTASNEDKEKCIEILELFRNKLFEKIIRYMPEQPIYQNNKQLNCEELGNRLLEKAGKSELPFLKHFVRTQIFAYFLQQHYESHNLALLS